MPECGSVLKSVFDRGAVQFYSKETRVMGRGGGEGMTGEF